MKRLPRQLRLTLCVSRFFVSVAVTLAALLIAAPSFAQFPIGPGGGGQPAAPPPGTPETHAASGAEQTGVPRTSSQLPEDPLAVPEDVKKRIGTNRTAEDDPQGTTGEKDVDFYGVYYSETDGDYTFRTVFPFWAERLQPGDRASVFGPYYQRRSDKFDADVVFPFFWHLRDEKTYTTVVGPFAHQETEGDDTTPSTHANWLFPLFFQGKTSDGGGYLHIPPLLTFTEHSDRDGFGMVGPLYCSWKGGPACDPRTTDEIDLGMVPFYFYGRNKTSEYEIIPPLLHFYSYDDIEDQEINLWGPLYWERHKDQEVFNIFPLFYRNWGPDEEHTTLFPFFHYGSDRTGGADSHLLVTPLFLDAEGSEGQHTFVTWGYAGYRGRTEYDMITPLFHWYRDPDIGLDTKLLFPFYYQSTSPRVDDLVLFPFYGHFKRPGISESTWVTPLFQHTHGLTGWSTNLYPLFFMGRTYEDTHFVVPPIVWDFATPKSRTTVVFPVYFRFSDPESVSQLALNTYYTEQKVAGGTDWEFHLFPALSFGASPQGHWWNILYGLAGYTRDGTMSKVRALYIPFKISE